MNKKWLDNPVTWRKYFKLSGVCVTITCVAYMAVAVKCVGVKGIVDIFRLLLKKD